MANVEKTVSTPIHRALRPLAGKNKLDNIGNYYISGTIGLLARPRTSRSSTWRLKMDAIIPGTFPNQLRWAKPSERSKTMPKGAPSTDPMYSPKH